SGAPARVWCSVGASGERLLGLQSFLSWCGMLGRREMSLVHQSLQLPPAVAQLPGLAKGDSQFKDSQRLILRQIRVLIRNLALDFAWWLGGIGARRLDVDLHVSPRASEQNHDSRVASEPRDGPQVVRKHEGVQVPAAGDDQLVAPTAKPR